MQRINDNTRSHCNVNRLVRQTMRRVKTCRSREEATVLRTSGPQGFSLCAINKEHLSYLFSNFSLTLHHFTCNARYLFLIKIIIIFYYINLIILTTRTSGLYRYADCGSYRRLAGSLGAWEWIPYPCYNSMTIPYTPYRKIAAH